MTSSKPDSGIAQFVRELLHDIVSSCGPTTNAAQRDDAATLASIVRGTHVFEHLPHIDKKTVRIFISSTFSDTKEERNAFIEHVYPRLTEYCRNEYGLEFQVVDMRWGVPAQASNNHSTTELCLQEIRKCKQVSAGPFLVCMLGQKYGYRPLPSEISVDEYTVLEDVAKELNRDWTLVGKWYLKDGNSTPPTYVLQPVTDTTNGADAGSWVDTERALRDTLKVCLRHAVSAGRLSAERAARYTSSVTEREIQEAVSAGEADRHINITRTITDIHQHLLETKAVKYIDMIVSKTESVVDEEAQTLLKALRERNANVKDANLISVETQWQQRISRSVSVSTLANDGQDLQAYLQDLCSQLYEKVRSAIDTQVQKVQYSFTETHKEILHHLNLAKTRCDVFEGREDMLQSVKTYLKDDTTDQPYIMYGPSGCGKTSVMCKLAHDIIHTMDTAEGAIVVLRLLGTSPGTSNLHQLLVSLCRQLTMVTGVKWRPPEKFADLIKAFWKCLKLATEKGRLYILLDSIDQLQDAYKAYRCEWLPQTLPLRCKMVLSTLSDNYPIYEHLQTRYQTATFTEVPPLPSNVGLTILQRWLARVNRCVTADQKKVIQDALTACGLPLHARILFETARTWRSYEQPALHSSTVQAAITALLDRVELTYGAVLVRHGLAHLTAARFGLSEPELEHLLSLDDHVLTDVFSFWQPPTRRLPPLLWARIRHELEPYLSERAADDVTVLTWYHRQFIAVSTQRYLSDSEFKTYIHSNLAQFFLGTWAKKKKPFTYTDAQITRFQLEQADSQADRKVPEQPYVFEHKGGLRYNHRKLRELPYHLLKSNNLKALKSEILLNYVWLHTKLKSSNPQELVQEYGLLVQEARELRKSRDLRLVFATLKLIRPYLYDAPDSLAVELSARLVGFIGQSPSITALVRQCDAMGADTGCPIVPLLTCFEVPSVGLHQNIVIRRSEPWHRGGGVCTSRDFRTLHVIDTEEAGDVILQTWDLTTGEKSRETQLEDYNQSVTKEVIVHCTLTSCETMMYIFLTQNRKQSEEFHSAGQIHVLDLTTAKVVKTFSHELHNIKQNFHHPVVFETENFLGVRCGSKKVVFAKNDNMNTDKYPLLKNGKADFNRAMALTSDEEYYVLAQSRAACLRKFTASPRDADVIEFDSSAGYTAAVISHDDNSAYFDGPNGEIHGFNITRRGHYKKKWTSPEKDGRYWTVHDKLETRTLKEHITLKLPSTESVSKDVDPTNKEGSVWFVELKMSPDDRYLLGVYGGRNPFADTWEAFLWSAERGVYLCRAARAVPLQVPTPRFTADSHALVVCAARHVTVLRAADGAVLSAHALTQSVRDMCLSHSAPCRAAVLLGTDVIVIDTHSEDEDNIPAGQPETDHDVTELLPAIRIHEHRYQNRLVLWRARPEQPLTCAQVCPYEDDAHAQLLSARARQQVALLAWTSPGGGLLAQLFACLQVVNTAQNRVLYTPQPGDVLVRRSAEKNTAETADFHTMSVRVTEMSAGDTITNGKVVKYEALSNNSGVTQIKKVPSRLVISQIVESKPVYVTEEIVYGETVLAFTENHLVTCRTDQNSTLKIYILKEDGQVVLHAVRSVTGDVQQCKFLNEETIVAATSHLTVTLFSGPSLTPTKATALQSTDSKVQIMDIIICSEAENTIVLKFRKEDNSLVAKTQVLVKIQVNNEGDLVTFPMTAIESGTVDSISPDGRLAVDTMLNIYNLDTGTRCQRIQLSDADDQRTVTSFSPRGDHLCVLNKSDMLLTLFSVTESQLQEQGRVFIHATAIDPFNPMSLMKLPQGFLVNILTADRKIEEDTEVKKTSDERGKINTVRLEDATMSDMARKKFLENDANHYIIKSGTYRKAATDILATDRGLWDVIIVTMGMTQIVRDPVEEIKQEVTTFVENALRVHPKAYIFLCTVLPNPAVRGAITTLNDHMTSLAHAHDRVTVADINDEISSRQQVNIKIKHMSTDLMNPTARGVDICADRIVRTLRERLADTHLAPYLTTRKAEKRDDTQRKPRLHNAERIVMSLVVRNTPNSSLTYSNERLRALSLIDNSDL